MSKQDDGLFLLEVLVDKVVFTKIPCFTDKDFRTCVNIECPSVEPIEICDDDSNVAKSGDAFVKTFNTGKSCLFSLKESEISKAMSKFPVKVTVYKVLPCGCLPTKIVLGEANIDMTKEFIQARNKFLDDPTNVSYQALKDSFRIMGSDGTESGEIVMFLRISCFGKLIVTRFQGGGTPTLGSGGTSGLVVDPSCNPQRQFQTQQDPCPCGAVRGAFSGTIAGSGIGKGACGPCPEARDPYNSMPCDGLDPDDPCYCSGPKPASKVPMVCRNTDQYCLHVPKGTRLKLPLNQNDRGVKYMALNHDLHQICKSQDQFITSFNEHLQFPKNQAQMYQDYKSIAKPITFLSKILMVYMTLFNKNCLYRSSGTQATALINKCLQVSGNRYYMTDIVGTNSAYDSTCLVSTIPCGEHKKNYYRGVRYQDIYFFGKERISDKKNRTSGMGKSDSKTKIGPAETLPIHESCISQGRSTQAQSKRCCSAAQTRGSTGSCVATSTGKVVSIKDEKPYCAIDEGGKNDMIATISHIRIGPKEPCPIHGNEPCQGPKCIAAAASGQQAPVKVTTATNPRRGVFELVIRRLNGAPLARNELMLEWTPPPSKPPPTSCSSCAVPPCSLSWRKPKCRPSACRQSHFKSKPEKSIKESCRTSHCRGNLYRPCQPAPCSPCLPSPCRPYPPLSLPCRRSCKQPCPRPCSQLFFRRCRRCVTHSPPCKPECSSYRGPCSLLCAPPCSFSCKRPCSTRYTRPCSPPYRQPCSPSCKRPCSPPCKQLCSPPSRRPCVPIICTPSPPCYRPACSSPCTPPSPSPCNPAPCSKSYCVSTCTRLCPVGQPKKIRRARSHPRVQAHKKPDSPCCNRSKTCPIVRCRSMPGGCCTTRC